MTAVPPRPAAPDATAGDGLRGKLFRALHDEFHDHWHLDQPSNLAASVLALPALRDVLAAAARDAEKVRRVEELRDALAETIAEAEAEAPGVRQIISPTVLLTWLDAALDGTP